MEKVKGQDIIGIHTLKSMYDQDSVRVTTADGRTYRMGCEEILKMVNEFTFSAEPKRVYTYLIDPKPV